MAESIGNILERVLRGYGIWDEIRDRQFLLEWEQIIGKKIAPFVKPVKFENGILWVSVSDPVWRSEIFNYKEKLVEKINEAIGGKVVEKIMVV